MRRTLLNLLLTLALLTGGLFPAATVVAQGPPPAPWNPYFAVPSTIYSYAGTNARPFGIAAGDFDEDGDIDLVVGRYTGEIDILEGNGDGTFAAPVGIGFRQAFFNAWAFAAADINGDGNLDIVWGANADSPSAAGTQVVFDADVRVWYGNGDGTFDTTGLYSTNYNPGTLLGRIAAAPTAAAMGAGSVATGDVDGDGDVDVVSGTVDGANTYVKLLRNGGAPPFAQETLVTQTTSTALQDPIYWPALSTQNSPWGLALSDADGDGDLDLWVGDRGLYVYLYLNNGAGEFTLKDGNDALATRPNAYLVHEPYRVSTTPTPALASGDFNGDGKGDVVLGLHSGGHTAPLAHDDGAILLDVSSGTGHTGLGTLADIGFVARGVTAIDVTGDTYLDIIASEYSGKIVLLRQLPPLDTDSDGISDYVDNAPAIANAPRLDMNTDVNINYRDQLDNDFDTELGNPEDVNTWVRLGDPADPDDDNDGEYDHVDNCPLVTNATQINQDGDLFGDACDPLDNRDADGDGYPDGPAPGDPLYANAMAARARWSQGTQHFVVRIDALGRFFQNEFTQLMTDAAILSPEEWAVKCWENYEPGDIPTDADYEPCGTGEGTVTQVLTLTGGIDVPISLVVIPKQLWSDPPVVTWINDRNNDVSLEIAQHGAYHANNTPLGDWAALADRNFYSCETCGLTAAENFELLKVGYDTLVGNYTNKWVAESGATGASPKIDWATSANPLISYAPPYNASDTLSRQATAQLGYRSFSASRFEEQGPLGAIFTPEGSHYLAFDQFGMFHASADIQLDPPPTANGAYNVAAYADELEAAVHPGGLTVWLIEEVEWSGRPCNDIERDDDPVCNGASNREDNTVYNARWDAWIQLLQFVKNYPDSIVMTLGDVALAKGSDNAPTVTNPEQADTNHNGIGDIIDGATLVAPAVTLTRTLPGLLEVTLQNGSSAPIAGQSITFHFDADGDGSDESYFATTDATGKAQAAVVPTRAAGSAPFSAAWNGVLVDAETTGTATVLQPTTLALDAGNPTSGQTTDSVEVEATLSEIDLTPIAGQTVTFTIGSAVAQATTDAAGRATATLTLADSAGATQLLVEYGGSSVYTAASAQAPFTINKEETTLAYTGEVRVAVPGAVLLTGSVAEAQDGSTGDITRAAVLFDVAPSGGGAPTAYGPVAPNASGVVSYSLAGGLAPGDYTAVVRMDPANGFYQATPTAPVSITATLKRHTLAVNRVGAGTVSSSPAGIDCGSTCSGSFADGTLVTLSATGAVTSTFAGWQGACESPAGTCEVQMDAAQVVTATFALLSYPVSITTEAEGGIILVQEVGVAGAAAIQENYLYGTVLQLTAEPNEGFVFEEWTGDLAGTQNPAMITVLGPLEIGALFVPEEVEFRSLLPLVRTE